MIPVRSMDCDTIDACRDDLTREVYCILGVPIDGIEMPDLVRSIERAAASALPFLISTPNLNFIVNSRTDRQFLESLLLSDLCCPDGMPIVWVARLMGLPIRRRTAGSDIFAALRQRQNPERPLKIFLFGATEQIAAAAAQRLSSVPGLRCVGWICPGFGSVDELSQDHFIDQINASNADFLVCALGAKKGQSWLLRNHSRLRIPVRAHLGATINFEAGAIKRAPLVMQKVGLEWLWRIKEEPSLFGRYWYDGWVLLGLLLTKVLPLTVAKCWDQLRGDRHRHDFVMVPFQNGTVVRVRISGHATAEHVPTAIVQFRDALASQKPLEVDLAQTRAVDARFLGLFLMLSKQLRSRGFNLKFVGVSPRLERQFRRNGLKYLLSTSQDHHDHAVN
jgi:N-acetylglucosaminyldiphosphoundecaprenol N-acetyl-beta-D-mannosaminyltransferase